MRKMFPFDDVIMNSIDVVQNRAGKTNSTFHVYTAWFEFKGHDLNVIVATYIAVIVFTFI